MLGFLRDRVSDRKSGLFAGAAAAHVWADAADAAVRAGIARAEAHAESGRPVRPGGGLAGIPSPMAGTFYDRPHPDAPPYVTVGSRVVPGTRVGLVEADMIFTHVESAQPGLVASVLVRTWATVREAEPLLALIPAPAGAAALYGHRSTASLARDIFGDPFRPATVDPGWQSADVLALARGIYEDRAFERLPLLADALMDAGCADEDILAHCRSKGPHVRGCWVVDLVLGKT
jgi:biotin carboxyl carrier protein